MDIVNFSNNLVCSASISEDAETTTHKNIFDEIYEDNGIASYATGYWSTSAICFGDIISNEQREIYDFLANNFSYATEEGKICTINTSMSSSEFNSNFEIAKWAYFLDYPERFWSDNWSISNFNKSSTSVSATITWASDFYSKASDVNSKMQRLNSEANSIINNMNNLPYVKSDTDKITYLHNWIIENVDYNNAAVDNIYSYPSAYSAYGAIVDKSAVCQGYSFALELLCKKAGINTLTVLGYKDTLSKKHAWNYVKLSGSYYLVDSTNDEIGYKYRYFMIPSSDIYVSNTKLNIPTTSSKPYIKYGDVNQDGSINILDVSLVSNYASTNNRSNISEIGFIAADVTGDNNVNSTDSNEILNKVLDSTYQLPVYNKLG